MQDTVQKIETFAEIREHPWTLSEDEVGRKLAAAFEVVSRDESREALKVSLEAAQQAAHRYASCRHTLWQGALHGTQVGHAAENRDHHYRRYARHRLIVNGLIDLLGDSPSTKLPAIKYQQ